MNTEQLIGNAAFAIEAFSSNNDSSLVLFIRNGSVCCCSRKDCALKHPDCLNVSRASITKGFTPKRWDTIGSALLSLYNKEKACQAHQKP